MVPLADPPAWFVNHIRAGESPSTPQIPSTQSGRVVPFGRHDDVNRLMANLARLGVSRENALHLALAELERGRWTRDVPLDELARGFDGADAKYRSGEWSGATTLGPNSNSNRRGLTFRPVGDLIANPVPIQWLIKGVLDRDSLALVFGDPGVGKSFLAIDLAASIATGRDWNNQRTCKAPVFYVAGEGSNGLARRFRAWEIQHATALSDEPLFVSTMPAALTDPTDAADAVETVEQLVEQHGRPGLIVVDTVARNFGPGDENSTKDMSAFVAACDALRVSTGAAVLLIHHSGHGDKSRARGAIALKGALDWEYAFIKEAGALALRCTKSKDADPPPPMAFRLETVNLGYADDDGEPVTSAVLIPTTSMPPSSKGKAGRGKNQTAALRVLREGIEEKAVELSNAGLPPSGACLTVNAWRDGCEKEGIARNRFHEIRDSLERERLICIDGECVTEPSHEIWTR